MSFESWLSEWLEKFTSCPSIPVYIALILIVAKNSLYWKEFPLITLRWLLSNPLFSHFTCVAYTKHLIIPFLASSLELRLEYDLEWDLSSQTVVFIFFFSFSEVPWIVQIIAYIQSAPCDTLIYIYI